MPQNPVVSLLACALLCALSVNAAAQTAAAAPPADPPKKKYDPHASPLAVIKDFRLWTDPPPAQDFVRSTRPDPKTLDYTPLTGKDPVRPTPRDKKGVEDLRAELESDLAKNTSKGRAAKVAQGNAAPQKVVRKRKKAADQASAIARPALPATAD